MGSKSSREIQVQPMKQLIYQRPTHLANIGRNSGAIEKSKNPSPSRRNTDLVTESMETGKTIESKDTPVKEIGPQSRTRKIKSTKKMGSDSVYQQVVKYRQNATSLTLEKESFTTHLKRDNKIQIEDLQ